MTDTEVDWKVPLELALGRMTAERDRLERLDGKIAAITAGSVAALGLFIDKSSGWPDLLAAAFLVYPLAILLKAYKPTDYQEVPNLETLVSTWPTYPKTFIKVLVAGTAESVAANARIIDDKALALEKAIRGLFWALCLIFAWRIGEAFQLEHQIGKPAVGATACSTRAPGPSITPTASATNACFSSGRGQKKRVK